MSGKRSQRPFWLGEDKRQWDHVRLHLSIFKDPRMGAYEQAIYGGIAVHAELQTGEAVPALETLARYAGCDERTVRRVLDRLVAWGYVEKELRPGKASIYRLLPPPTLDSQSGVPDEGADTGSGVPRTQSPTGPDTESDEQERQDLEPPLTPPLRGGDVGTRTGTQTVNCPACGADPGHPCLNSRGNPRASNHRERINLAASTFDPSKKLAEARQRIDDCKTCGGRGFIDPDDDNVARYCPDCRGVAAS